jgi:zinc transporter 9
MAHESKQAVITAIAANGVVTLIKFMAATLSGSAAMFNEAIHSLMDTLNQGFLFLGLREGERPADQVYAFGHGQKKYLWNLWSAIGLFSIGAGLGLAHAWHAWHQLDAGVAAEAIHLLGIAIAPLWINLAVLAIAVLLEGYSFLVAMREFLARMRRDGETSPLSYLATANDPTLLAVVLEDSVAVFGLSLAACGIVLSAVTGNGAWDVGFSALIAVLLGLIAFYLGWVNMRFLTDMRDPLAEQALLQVIHAHPEVERCHDVRSIVLDETHTVLVAEVELREEAMVAGLYEQMVGRRDQLMDLIPSERRQDDNLARYVTARASVESTLTRAETIIDELTHEVRMHAPQVSHVTIEVEGLAPIEEASAAPAST